MSNKQEERAEAVFTFQQELLDNYQEFADRISTSFEDALAREADERERLLRGSGRLGAARERFFDTVRRNRRDEARQTREQDGPASHEEDAPSGTIIVMKDGVVVEIIDDSDRAREGRRG